MSQSEEDLYLGLDMSASTSSGAFSGSNSWMLRCDPGSFQRQMYEQVTATSPLSPVAAFNKWQSHEARMERKQEAMDDLEWERFPVNELADLEFKEPPPVRAPPSSPRRINGDDPENEISNTLWNDMLIAEQLCKLANGIKKKSGETRLRKERSDMRGQDGADDGSIEQCAEHTATELTYIDEKSENN
ncbi:uncharacterized protein LOC115627625 isoform X2 [Scaptodrosophila lebanonensis]|uniref:Uncharacterized protein LOC115627625 isoform X2 n=1 Tax=Drosophila lebanonensis TaxID=7225 RepID=A0A6J2TRD8_DROLE|nr:uncharacterized protein LOC115627625 isoform X2 [Scaptodrosophila lebanonensis]